MVASSVRVPSLQAGVTVQSVQPSTMTTRGLRESALTHRSGTLARARDGVNGSVTPRRWTEGRAPATRPRKGPTSLPRCLTGAMTAALSLRGLTKSFGPKRAVDGLDLEVRRGCMFG